MLRKFAALLVLGALTPLVGCQNTEAPTDDVDTPVIDSGEDLGTDPDADMDSDLDSDAAFDDSNATTGN